jgi:hypothetical protein
MSYIQRKIEEFLDWISDSLVDLDLEFFDDEV